MSQSIPDPGSADASELPEALFDLVDAIEELSGARSVEEVAAMVRTSARKISKADGVAFVLRDGDQCHYFDEDAIGPLWKGRRFPLTACISGWAMLNRSMAVIPDIYVDDRVPHDAYRPTFVKSLVMTPVRVSDPIAAIGAYWSEERSWSRRELVQLEAIARATATALENARLYASLTEALVRSDLLVRELDHRVKNTLATVQAIAFQTRRASDTKEAFVLALDGRLQALARAHELLTSQAWDHATLRALLGAALLPFSPQGSDRIVLSGPEVRLAPEAAMTLHMTFHELAANAAKHGALSDQTGRVSVDWRADTVNGLKLTWVESGGPAVMEPARRGFGARLIERGLSVDLGGSGLLNFAPEGLKFEMSVPLDHRISVS